MINNFYGWQGIDISNLRVGVKGPNSSLGPANLDNIVQFSDVNAKLYNINVRADAYLFPFFNVYGLLGYIPYSRTHVELSEPVQLVAEPKQNGWMYGFGSMVAFGFGPVWMQADYNMTWADMELLNNKVFTQIIGVRMGHVFPLSNPERNISMWLGAMGMFLNNRTVGEINMGDLFPGISESQVNDGTQNYSTNPSLNPMQKEIMDKIMQKISDRLHNIPVDDTYITYEMDKTPTSKWAGLAGIQYQFSKRWQLRSESNFISGDRFSILLSINYRFLGFKKKMPGN
jgi:hypothetical protein